MKLCTLCSVKPFIFFSFSRHQFDSLVDTTFSIQPDIIRSAAKYIYSDPNCTDHGRKTRFYGNQMNQIVGDYFFSCDSLWLADQVPPNCLNSSRKRAHLSVFCLQFCSLSNKSMSSSLPTASSKLKSKVFVYFFTQSSRFVPFFISP